MENEKTRLQKIVEQLTEKLAIAIEQAINEGAEIDKDNIFPSVTTIDGVCVQKSVYGSNDACIVINFKSKKMREIFCKKERKELEKRIEELNKKMEECKS